MNPQSGRWVVENADTLRFLNPGESDDGDLIYTTRRSVRAVVQPSAFAALVRLVERSSEPVQEEAERPQTMAAIVALPWDEHYGSRVERAICTTSQDGRAAELVNTTRGWQIRFGELSFDRDALENGSESWWIPNDMAARIVAAFTSGWVAPSEPPPPVTRTIRADELRPGMRLPQAPDRPIHRVTVEYRDDRIQVTGYPLGSGPGLIGAQAHYDIEVIAGQELEG